MEQVVAGAGGAFVRRCGCGSHGFTLIELLVTLTVLVILLGLAVPSMIGLVVVRRANVLANELITSINFARSEAIKRNDRVVLCKSADGASCDVIGGWHVGWILFHDPNNNAQRDAGEVVLRRQNAVSDGVTLLGNSPIANYVSMSSSGVSKYSSGAFQAGTFTICTNPIREESVRQVVLSVSGRARIQKGTLGNCN